MASEAVQARAQLGVAVRTRKSKAKIEDARRTLAAAKLADYVRKVVAEAPPLTSEQADRIAALLRPVKTTRGDAA